MMLAMDKTIKEQDTQEKEQDKRDGLVAEWILRIASLEKVLISKGLITQDELAHSYLESVAKLGELMSVVQTAEERQQN
jgi:hypothetical protein